MSSAKEIGEKLVALCKAGKGLESVNTLYAENIVSVEAAETGGDMPRIMEGLAAVRGKNEWWYKTMEVKSSTIEGPFPHGDDRFAVIFDFHVKNKETGDEMKLREVGVFYVENDKVVREEFFYGG